MILQVPYLVPSFVILLVTGGSVQMEQADCRSRQAINPVRRVFLSSCGVVPALAGNRNRYA
jgi:hypothetical protein